MAKKLSKPQATALWHIELDGGLIKTHGQEWPYTTTKGRPINAVTALWLIEHDHLIAHQDGMFNNDTPQTWEVKIKVNV